MYLIAIIRSQTLSEVKNFGFKKHLMDFAFTIYYQRDYYFKRFVILINYQTFKFYFLKNFLIAKIIFLILKKLIKNYLNINILVFKYN